MGKPNKVLTIVLVVTILVVAAIPAIASNLTKDATLTYRNIRITLDGQEIQPTDANGNYVEPFIIDGTTYLPVRGVASALGLDVSWDSDTSTVELSSGSNPAPVESSASYPAEEPAVIPATEEPEPLDLTGLWIQDNASSGGYFTAVIRDDGSIGVFFINGDDGSNWTYWVGTYEAPSTDTDEYSWLSSNTYEGHGLFASSADTKEFTYQSGKIVFPISLQGQSGYLTLVRDFWDVSSIPESAFGSASIGG